VAAVYSTFLQRAYDQLVEDVALQQVPAVFVLDRAGLVGGDGPTHHGAFDIAYLRNIPEFVLMAPAHKKDLEHSLEFALESEAPSAIRYPKDFVLEINQSPAFSLGRSEIIRQGKDIAVLALGSLLKETLAVWDDLAREGINPLLVNPRFIKPLDEPLLLELSKEFHSLLILEEGVLTGGFGEGILEFYRSKGLLKNLNIQRMGLPCEFITFGKRSTLLKHCGLDSENIFNRIKKIHFEAKSYGRVSSR